MGGVLDTMAGATTGTQKITLILDAALDAQWTELSQQLDDAAQSDVKSGSLALPETTRIVNAMDEIRDRVEASQVTFEFAPMDWLERVDLQAAHPPRDGNVGDRMRGFNASYIPALIKASCVKVTDATGDEATEIPASTWDHLLGHPGAPNADPPVPRVKAALAPGQVTRLYAKAQAANQGDTQVPPSARFLLGSQDSEASLAQPSPGTSRQSGSKGGSPSGSRRSSTAKKAASTKAGLSAS